MSPESFSIVTTAIATWPVDLSVTTRIDACAMFQELVKFLINDAAAHRVTLRGPAADLAGMDEVRRAYLGS